MQDSDKQLNLPLREEQVLKFWEEHKIFEKSLVKTKGGKLFVFYEGPPTANGLPGIHHVEARVFKDVIPRYKTMRGFFVPRRAGWDTHGLPVEIQVEKELGFKTKHDIEKYGIARFNKKAKESVWRFKEEWERLTKRIGFWLDMEHPYVTYETTYIETLWWIIKKIYKKGLLVKDFKVVPWCPRCGTGLSSHELGQPGAYRRTKDNSIFVKFKIKGPNHEYFLVWTTTPWTLPANVAIAIHPQIEYTKFKIGEEYFWSYTTPPFTKPGEVEIIEKVSGKSLLGINYEPLFSVPKEYSLGKDPEYVTIPGEFVSVEEGTGMVHIAPAFGDDDMASAKKKWPEQYPIIQTVNLDGTMKKGIMGAGKFVKDADSDIINDLKRRGLLYHLMPYEHDYPHCWRCDAPLIYFAKNSWWIRTTALKEKLIENNEKINWIPAHLKYGRFGEFLNELRDWAFSRERYWGTSLPIWICEKCKHQEVIGSREELHEKSGGAKNKYYIMRHGESESNIKNILSLDGTHHLTLRGRTQVEKTAKKLISKKIDFIFASPVLRTRETAQIASKILGIKEIFFDKRIQEVDFGIFNDKAPKEYHDYFSSLIEKFIKRPPEGETLTELRKRTVNFLNERENKFSGKNILIISHEYPLWMLYGGALGLSDKETVALRKGEREEEFIRFAELMKTEYKNLPRDENEKVNLHRPYTDTFSFSCSACGGFMRRVSEVADVWFDSGAMPFAQIHYPFENKLEYPAEYISEAVDQTRGWFYTLLAVGALLNKGPAYKNVVSLGHVLDKNGQKMSKSKGNIVEPWQIIKKYGADALRWYFYTINGPGDPKRFDEKDVFNRLRGFIGTFWNSFQLFDTYVGGIKYKKPPSGNILDKWILIRLNNLIYDVTENHLEKYDITAAARKLEEFLINDFSQWYLRRSRERLQRPGSQKEKNEAALTIAHVLLEFTKLSAPFVPFLAEAVYQGLKIKIKLKEKSVHLNPWPESKLRGDKYSNDILEDITIIREIVTGAFKLRAEAGIKVRQPLSKLEVYQYTLRNKNKALLELIKDEVNVKEVVFLGGGEKRVVLDTVLTPELKNEGFIRELTRNVQEMRKGAGLRPKDKIRVQYSGPREYEDIIQKHKKDIKEKSGATEVVVGGKKIFTTEREFEFDGLLMWIGIAVRK